MGSIYDGVPKVLHATELPSQRAFYPEVSSLPCPERHRKARSRLPRVQNYRFRLGQPLRAECRLERELDQLYLPSALLPDLR